MLVHPIACAILSYSATYLLALAGGLLGAVTVYFCPPFFSVGPFTFQPGKGYFYIGVTVGPNIPSTGKLAIIEQFDILARVLASVQKNAT